MLHQNLLVTFIDFGDNKEPAIAKRGNCWKRYSGDSAPINGLGVRPEPQLSCTADHFYEADRCCSTLLEYTAYMLSANGYAVSAQ
jgi:hypothetical protein